jgi:predicted metalloprotease with PDZ domain
VLRAQRDRTRAAAQPPQITAAFADEMRRAGLDIAADSDRYLTQAEPLLLPADAFGRCAVVRTQEVPVFERGWDSDATAKADNVFTGVDPASNAYAAGLRDGMRFLKRIAGEPGDAATDYVLEVQDGPTQRRLTFRPAGRRTITTQRIDLLPERFARDRAACTAALSG